MTEHEDLIAECDKADSAMKKWVRVPVKYIREVVSALEHVTAERDELIEERRRVEKCLRMERVAGRELLERADLLRGRAQARREQV